MYLLQISAPEARRQDNSEIYTKLTLAQLQEKIPQINWKEYLTNVFLTDVKPEEPIVFYSLSYFIELGKMLADTDRR